MNKFIHIIFTALLISSCASVNSEPLTYKSWHLGFSAPDYMEVWIETADVIDVQGQVFRRAMSGVASLQTPPNNSGDPRGWPKRIGIGGGKYVTGADLPKKIFVRWQSLVEPQTYKMDIDISESTRELMRKEEKAFCAADGKWITGYRQSIAVRLVPGGIAKIWVGGPCMTPIEIARIKAEVDPRGPYEGKSAGQYDSLSAVSKAYVNKFGVPYGSW
ncbi:Protein of uncharacterised function (DUF2931) [Pseudomonas fluorescens]|uniref:Protein of uncharacterized function (DUF2931) n=1 Tax=Pseudomonas fluorescens TaxID=294 RepID=A0A448DWL6_PSEFL|nr:DUF2931 family protein [Pseudomonas fluorescens]VEF11255.1 Protein of uncharacterised function (DUF2931) [Pseudomonas fluorescens]